MEILTSVRRLYISFKSLVNDFVYSFGRAALLLLLEVQNHTVPVRERRRIRVNRLFKVLPSYHLQFGLYFSIVFGIMLLFILFICRNKFDLYLLRFWSTNSNFSSSKMSSFIFWAKRVYPAILLKQFISSSLCQSYFVPFLITQISLPCRRRKGGGSKLVHHILEGF